MEYPHQWNKIIVPCLKGTSLARRNWISTNLVTYFLWTDDRLFTYSFVVYSNLISRLTCQILFSFRWGTGYFYWKRFLLKICDSQWILASSPNFVKIHELTWESVRNVFRNYLEVVKLCYLEIFFLYWSS